MERSLETARPVTNPIASIPSRGHSKKTTRLKLYCVESELVICSATPKIDLTTGMMRITRSFTTISPRPALVLIASPVR